MSVKVKRVVCMGEAMLELSRHSGQGQGDLWRLGYGGDTLNTAVHLARAGLDTAYFTAIGSDALSDDLTAQWQAEGLDTSLVLVHPQRSTGLYAITTDDQGERTFSYWRDRSGAKAVFELPEAQAAMVRVEQADLLAFSLISLAVLPPDGREQLLKLAARVRANGGMVAFDGNYRPRLWQGGAEEAMAARDAAIAVAHIGLPTLEDETMLSGEASAEAVAAHWQGLGCQEVVVKMGADGCYLPSGQIVAPQQVLQPVDTSGAGDAFNGGYLAARMKGAEVLDAALAGHATAGWTIMRRGGIPPRDKV